MEVSELGGYLGVLGAVIFFGSFGITTKTRPMRELNVSPFVIQAYMTCAIFITSWIVALYTPFHFTYWGIVSACLWVPANCLAVAAIQLAGLAVSQGVWSGVTIAVSFVWGEAVFHDAEIHDVGLKVLGVVILVLGIAGLAATLHEKKPEKDLSDDEEKYQEVAVNDDISLLKNVDESPIDPTPTSILRRRKIMGLTCAVILGFMNGSMLVPMKFVPPEASGITFAVSFGIGVLLVTPVFVGGFFALKREMPQFHWRVAWWRGGLAGLFWNIGNVSSMYAALSPLGLTIGFPLTQCALLVAGLWGMFYFKEIKGVKRSIAFFIASLILLGGATMLSLVG